MKTIQVRRTRHAGHCWRNKDELISNVLLSTPAYAQAKAGRPARTYIQQLCEDTGCNPEDLPEAMNDREKWRERARDIRASGTTWWWWHMICKRIICNFILKWARTNLFALFNDMFTICYLDWYNNSFWSIDYTIVAGDQKAPFSIATTPRCRRGCYYFPWIAPLYP